MRKHHAFTLIELIISIVIIGISSASLAVMLTSANNLESQNVNQDIYFKSTTVMNDILSKAWDASIATLLSATSSTYPIPVSPLFLPVSTATGDATLQVVANTSTRVGNFGRTSADFRQFYNTSLLSSLGISGASSLTTTNTPIADTSTMDSIDAYNGGYIDESSGNGQVRYDVSVVYVPDSAQQDASDATGQTLTTSWNLNGGQTYTNAAQSTNLKRILIRATRGSFTVGFSYFSSNVGSYNLKTAVPQP